MFLQPRSVDDAGERINRVCAGTGRPRYLGPNSRHKPILHYSIQLPPPLKRIQVSSFVKEED